MIFLAILLGIKFLIMIQDTNNKQDNLRDNQTSVVLNNVYVVPGDTFHIAAGDTRLSFVLMEIVDGILDIMGQSMDYAGKRAEIPASKFEAATDRTFLNIFNQFAK